MGPGTEGGPHPINFTTSWLHQSELHSCCSPLNHFSTIIRQYSQMNFFDQYWVRGQIHPKHSILQLSISFPLVLVRRFACRCIQIRRAVWHAASILPCPCSLSLVNSALRVMRIELEANFWHVHSYPPSYCCVVDWGLVLLLSDFRRDRFFTDFSFLE